MDSHIPGHLELKENLSCPFRLDIYTEISTNDDEKEPTGQNARMSPPIPTRPVAIRPQDPHTPACLPASVVATLPIIMDSRMTGRKPGASSGRVILQVADNIEEFLAADLDVKRLNDIHSKMWMCGRPLNARGLHRQMLMERKVIQTEQADLHLLYHKNVLFIKPLPAYLLCPAAWQGYFNATPHLHANACGFLLSYVWLLRSPLDYHFAVQEQLLPPNLTWTAWKEIVKEFLESVDVNTLDQVNKRYHFGELRLGRINTIYRLNPRFFHTHFVRGYLYGYNRYVVFFQRNVGWVLVVFVWFSLILSAMQVGVTVDGLQGNQAFNRASYGFVIFSIVAVAALLAFVSVVFVVVFVYNMFAAISHARTEERRRRKLGEERRRGVKGA